MHFVSKLVQKIIIDWKILQKCNFRSYRNYTAYDLNMYFSKIVGDAKLTHPHCIKNGGVASPPFYTLVVGQQLAGLSEIVGMPDLALVL